MQSAELPAASAARRCSLGLLTLVMFAVGTSTFGAESDEEVWDVTSEPLEAFEVTATFDYHSDWNELPVPRGTTYEDYYGSGRSILHGPGKTWHIEKPYVFKFVRQEGAKLFFHFEHREAIAHAFIGHGLYGNRFEPRNPGISAFHRFKWRPISGGGCYTALRTFILEPNHPYNVVVWFPLTTSRQSHSIRLKVDMDTGCWLKFQSEPFRIRIPYEDPAAFDPAESERLE